jgi:23S rRNA (uracil1939-C5)-methyltransferase
LNAPSSWRMLPGHRDASFEVPMSDPTTRESGELVPIHALAFGGDGVGRLPKGKAVFVPGTAPGERVRVRITQEKRSHAFAELVTIEEAAEHRVAPRCPVADTCGGCTWQHLEIGAQREWKARLIGAELSRRGLDPDGSVQGELVAAGDGFGHRSRTRMHLRGKTFGTGRRRSHETIPLGSCPVLAPELEDFARAFGDYATTRLSTDADVELYVDRLGRRGLYVRAFEAVPGRAWGELAANLAVHALRVKAVRGAPPGRLGSVGDATLEEDSAGLPLGFEPGAFVQTSRGINGLLVGSALELVEPAESFAELYAGVGNFSVHLQERFERGSIAEGAPQALASLRANLARRDGALEPGGGSAKAGPGVQVYREHDAESAKRLCGQDALDLLFVDPPRAGIKALYPLFEAAPPKTLLMVSCHPMAALRDLEWLHKEAGYRLDRLVPVDLFPQTAHLEIVARLRATP